MDSSRPLLEMSGVSDIVSREHSRAVAETVAELRDLGVSEDALQAVEQAYVRAVVRVTAAEAEALGELLAKQPQSLDGEQLAALSEATQRYGQEVLTALHLPMLTKILSSNAAFAERGQSTRGTAVAHVDVVGSTALLNSGSVQDTRRLADALFAAGQTAIRGTGVTAIKYLGDGVLMVGADPEDVTRAALECMNLLSDAFGFEARGGLAYGPVVHRAGDVFGLPVNIAYLLTKSALPGTLLMPADTAALLPDTAGSERTAVRVSGLPDPLQAIEIPAR